MSNQIEINKATSVAPFAFRTIERRGREAPNANGYFVQNGHGATVAGPFATPHEAWREEDRLRLNAWRSREKS